ncbi:phage tail protein [Xanthobacter sp. VTT E-85241]|uniref:phage tail-collar fiber domain-containing protein n=1 Tax=Roseixanthobacter finlandensis TaxID=3119922 RepID=UPI003729A0DC
MSNEYIGVVTLAGQAAIAGSIGGTPLSLTTVRVGDGNGVPITPNETMTDLVRRVGAAYGIAASGRDPVNPTMWRITAVIPAADGPFDIREIGVFDAAGTLIALAKHPFVEKRSPAQGNAVELTTDIVFPISDTAQITINLLPDVAVHIGQMLRAPFLVADSATTTAPPASPALGATYVIPTGATGAWAGADLTNRLAQWTGEVWAAVDVPAGHLVVAGDKGLSDPSRYLSRTAAGWGPELPVAIRAGVWNYVAAGGTASALTIALSPAIAAYSEILGTPLRVMISAENAGPATLNVNGIGAQPIKTMRGATLNRGDLPAGAIVTVIWAGSAFLLSGVAYQDIRIKLTGDATVYVSNAGSDSTGDGSAAHPWATIEHAYNQVRRLYDTAGYQVTISCAPGTYAGGTLTGPLPGLGMVYILGSGSSPSDVVIGPLSVQTGAYVRFDRVRHSAPTSAGVSAYSSNVYFMDVDFGPCLYSQVQAYGGSFVLFQSGYRISSGGQNHIYASGRSYISYATPGPIPVAITGTPSFTDQFAWADSMSTITAMSAVFSGASTGKRHTIDQNSLCVTGGGGVNFFPGSVAGAVSNDAVFI